MAELLGPLKSPYASVITMTDKTSRLVGSKVFGGGFAKNNVTGTGLWPLPFEIVKNKRKVHI